MPHRSNRNRERRAAAQAVDASMPSFARPLRVPTVALILAALVVLFCGLCGVGAEGEPHENPAAKHDDHAKPVADANHDAHAAHKVSTASEHVIDNDEFHFFTILWPQHFGLPPIFGFQITKFMLLEVLAALLVIA